ncbi:MAG: response regulator transcription factor [Verrucomicrobiales bacterium]|jgi:DNA-binding NarL/FixJ family response regulator|nr:response regulator transcription factor [Verrucomicrobiales bacterium]
MNPATPRPRILVIEDEPQMLRNLTTILRAEGFDTQGVSLGTEGVAAARRLPPDLILCDVMMPGLDGFAVLEQLRADAATARIPFIFLTARGDRGDVRTGMNLGADDYLSKPVRTEDLLSAIRARLARARQTTAVLTLTAPEHASALETLGLSPREAEVLFWLIQGKSNGDIATILGVAEATVKKHLERVFAKLGVENRTSAARCALDRLAAGGGNSAPR